jgi:hypothetical protein
VGSDEGCHRPGGTLALARRGRCHHPPPPQGSSSRLLSSRRLGEEAAEALQPSTIGAAAVDQACEHCPRSSPAFADAWRPAPRARRRHHRREAPSRCFLHRPAQSPCSPCPRRHPEADSAVLPSCSAPILNLTVGPILAGRCSGGQQREVGRSVCALCRRLRQRQVSLTSRPSVDGSINKML